MPDHKNCRFLLACVYCIIIVLIYSVCYNLVRSGYVSFGCLPSSCVTKYSFICCVALCLQYFFNVSLLNNARSFCWFWREWANIRFWWKDTCCGTFESQIWLQKVRLQLMQISFFFTYLLYYTVIFFFLLIC